MLLAGPRLGQSCSAGPGRAGHTASSRVICTRRERSGLYCSATSQDVKHAVAKPPATAGETDMAEALAAAPTAKAKLELLSQLQNRSKNALQAGLYATGAPRMIDARMYSAALESQRKLTQKLTDANAYISYLEQKVDSYGEELQAAAETLKKISMEFGTTDRLAQAAAAAVRFGVDKEDAVAKIAKLRERLEALEKAMKEEREAFSKKVPCKVPVTWVGSATEVRLVGDFDNWTRGVDLGTPDVESDDVLRTFEATVQLLPGRYRVKFMVDGEWRLAPEWPTENNEVGETNNILEVK